MKEPEKENARLKKMVAQLARDIDVLRLYPKTARLNKMWAQAS